MSWNTEAEVQLNCDAEGSSKLGVPNMWGMTEVGGPLRALRYKIP
jgi:hypothetical protein